MKTTEAGGTRGYDAGEKVSGRKRHIVVDTLGLLLAVVVTAANVSDVAGARQALSRARDWSPRLRLLWTNQAYTGVVAWALTTYTWTISLVRKLAEQHTFVPLPCRWV